jgi:hypothetical protein
MKLLYYTKKRKLNKLNSLENNKKIVIIKSLCKKNKKKKWKIEFKNNKKEFKEQKLKNSENKNSTLREKKLRKRSLKRKSWSDRKKQRWCKWKCLRWNLLRSCKTLKPFKNKLTLSLKKLLIIDQQWLLLMCTCRVDSWELEEVSSMDSRRDWMAKAVASIIWTQP